MALRVHFETPVGFGYSIQRVESAFKRFAPECLRFVGKDGFDEADLVIMQFIGRDQLVDRVMESGKPYVVLLYCFTPGQDLSNVKPLFDYELLRRAVCAYSFHALEEMGFQGRFLLGPLGVDPEVFYLEPHIERVNSVLATGYISGSEALHEVYTAARRTGGRMMHVGGDLTRECNCVFEDAFYVRYENVTDDKMRELYNSCKYVSGLRRCCGFELPVLEGLLCGCRPICFDNLHYTRWFRDIAIFVPETFDRLVDDLTEVLQSDYRPVTQSEIDYVIETFSWRRVAQMFWDFVLKHFDS